MGTLIGVERQFRQRNAGLRTNILVSVGAAAFTVLSYAMTAEEGDPSRVAAQIVSGIGFLGGGLILKDGFTVRGLNTAATIWCSAACGTLSGVGLYREAAILVAFVLVTHCLFRPLCTFLGKRTAGVFHYSVRAECQRNVSESIQKLIMDTLAFDKNVKLNSLFYKGDEERVTVCCDMERWENTRRYSTASFLASALAPRYIVPDGRRKRPHRRTSNSVIMVRAQTRMIEEQYFITSKQVKQCQCNKPYRV